jgi:energy-coupling factor transporter ATP-binding protein EcfA2
VAETQAPAEGKGTEEQEQAKGAARLLELVRQAGAVPFRDDTGDAYLAVPVAGCARKTVRVRSREARTWLAYLSHTRDGKPASGPAVDGALGVLEGTALHDPDAPCLPLAVRVAERDSAIWYDLGGPDWRAVRVTADGWDVRPAPTLFRRYGHMAAQVTPTPGGDLRRLLDYLPVAEGMDALLLPWLVAALVPSIARPALVLHGPAGTGKTTTMRALRRLIDPSATEVLTLPHDPAQLVQTLAHHYAVPLDNEDRLGADTSDALCRAVTGDGATKRALYTDDDDVVYRYRRVLLVSGVTCVAQRPDLLDRSLLLALRPIAPADRREEEEYWTAYEADRPAMLGGLLDALSTAMRLRPSVRLREHARMADYAAWAYAAAEALGIGGDAAMAAYACNVRRQTDEALSAHPVGQALRVLLDGRDGWEGTPAALLEALEQVAERERIDTHGRAWPKTPNALRRRIAEVQHNLLAEGLVVDLDAHGGDRGRERRWCIRRAGTEVREIPSAPSASSAPYSAMARRADDTAARRDTVGVSSAWEPVAPKPADGADDADDASLTSLSCAPEVEEVAI